MEQTFPFQLTPLPYGYIGLMPRCDANTLYYHHDEFYSKAIYELNNLSVHHRLTDRTLEQLISEDFNIPVTQQNRLRNEAGAVYNHRMFFDGISPKSGIPPVNGLTEAIAATYGSMDQFERLFTEAAQSIIGSGWVWLVSEGGHGLHIATTINNEVVPLASVTPILILDMWEHAYFCNQHFNKAAYVSNWFSLINWNIANQLYSDSMKKNAGHRARG